MFSLHDVKCLQKLLTDIMTLHNIMSPVKTTRSEKICKRSKKMDLYVLTESVKLNPVCEKM